MIGNLGRTRVAMMLAALALILATCVAGVTPLSGLAPASASGGGTGQFLLLAASVTSLYTIDPTTQVESTVFVAPTNDLITGVAVGPTGVAWVVYHGDVCTVTTLVCPGSAVSVNLLTDVVGSPVSAGVNPTGASLSPDGSTLYVTDCGADAGIDCTSSFNVDEVLPIDTATGVASTPIPIVVAGSPYTVNECGSSGADNNVQTSQDGSTPTLYIGSDGPVVAVDLATGNSQLLQLPGPETNPTGGFFDCPLVLNPNDTTAYGFVDPTSSSYYGVARLVAATGVGLATPLQTSILASSTFPGNAGPEGTQAYQALTPDGNTLLVDGPLGEASSNISSDSVGLQSVNFSARTVSTAVSVLGAGWQASGLVVSPDGQSAYVSADEDNGGFIESEVVPVALSNGVIGSIGAPFATLSSFTPATQIEALIPVVLPEGSTGAPSCTGSPDFANAAGFTWATASASSANQADVNYTLSACGNTLGDTYTWSVPGYNNFNGGVGPLDVALPDGGNQITLTVTDSNGAVVAQLSQTINVVPVPNLVIVPGGEVPSPASKLDVRFTLNDCATQGATSYVVSVDGGTVGSTAASCDDAFTVDVPAGAHTVQLSTSDAGGDEVTTSLTLDALPIPALEVNETALAPGATLDAVVLNACASVGGTKFYFSVNDPSGDTVIGGNIGDDSVCSDTFDVTPGATYNFSVQVTDATGSTSNFQSSITQSYDVNPPPAPGNNGCIWNPLSAESCIYNIAGTVADVLLGGTARPPDFIVASGSVAAGLESDVGWEVTCDGSVFESIGAGIGTPGASAVVADGWVGSPYGPEPTNGEIDGFLAGLSENVQGGVIGGLELEAEGNQIAYVTSLGLQAGASVTITDGLSQGKLGNAPATPTNYCRPAWLENEVGLLAPAGLPSSLPTSAASLQFTVGSPPPTVTGEEIVAITGVGAQPDSVVIANIGDPAYFGRAVADANGDFTIVGTIDPSLAPGANTLYIDGTAAGGGALALSTPITVVARAQPVTTPPGAPSAPSELTATRGNTTATLTWNPPTSNGGSAITGYIITPSSGPAFSVGDVTNDTVTGLTDGTNYTFTVAAINVVGTGPSSIASASLTPLKATSKTALKLSARRVTYGHERVEHLSVSVSPKKSGLTPTGTVSVKESTKTLCVIKLTSGNGICRFANKRLKAGTYHLVVTYRGSTTFNRSVSIKETLIVARAPRRHSRGR